MTKTAQDWLNANYSNKTIGGKIELYDKMEELTGELLIEGYNNVEEINFERWDKVNDSELKGKITKVTISNCPKLKKLKLNNNEISEIIFEGNFPNLVRLDATDNKLPEIDVSKVPNLTWLNLARSTTTGIKGLECLVNLEFVNLDSPGFNGSGYGKWKDAIKGILNIPLTDPLPETWETDLKTKLDELEKAEKERDSRPNITPDEYQKLLDNQKPDGLPGNWQQQIADKDKYLKERDERPDITNETWNDHKDRPTQKKLDEAVENERKKVQDYENGLKNALGLKPNDNLPTDWQTQLAKKDDDSKSKPIGAISQEEYDKLLKQKNSRPNITLDQYNTIEIYIKKKLGKIKWQEVILGPNWEAKIEQI